MGMVGVILLKVMASTHAIHFCANDIWPATLYGGENCEKKRILICQNADAVMSINFNIFLYDQHLAKHIMIMLI